VETGFPSGRAIKQELRGDDARRGGEAHAQHPDAQPTASATARGLFEHRLRQDVGVSVPRRTGRHGHGGKIPTDFEGQCAQVFANIGAALASQGANFRNVVAFTSYLVHSQDIAKFVQYGAREFPRLFAGGAYPPNTLLVIDRLVREEFLIEVSAVAAV
jgi:enamine deaminase RidA (YjgF/YER057c/UK114 family)